ncbi:MAG: prefoldin domain-containing protein [bacterium]
MGILPVCSADLNAYRETFQTNSEDILQSYQPKFADLQQQYRKSLEALKTLVQNQGDLAKTKAAIAELDRFQKEKSLPATLDENELPEIKAFQAAYVKQYVKLETDMTVKLGTLTTKYERELERLQKDMVKAGKLDEATAVLEEREKAQRALKDYADQLSALREPSAANETGATSRTPEPVEKTPGPKILFKEKDSMPLYPISTKRDAFPVQETDDPTGPFSGKAVYFDQRQGGKDVVYSVQFPRSVKQVHWKGAAMENMTIEVRDSNGKSLAMGGPYKGGNTWADFTVDFPPSKQFSIRIHNNASQWLLIAAIDLVPEPVPEKSDTLKPSWKTSEKTGKPKVVFKEKDSMPLYPKSTKHGEFPVQKTDDPTGPFSGKAVYFDQRGGKDVVYSIQSISRLKKLHWKGAAMENMTIEILDPNGKSLAMGGPYTGGNIWAEFTVDFPPSNQFLIRIHNNISHWLLIAAIDLE